MDPDRLFLPPKFDFLNRTLVDVNDEHGRYPYINEFSRPFFHSITYNDLTLNMEPRYKASTRPPTTDRVSGTDYWGGGSIQPGDQVEYRPIGGPEDNVSHSTGEIQQVLQDDGGVWIRLYNPVVVTNCWSNRKPDTQFSTIKLARLPIIKYVTGAARGVCGY